MVAENLLEFDVSQNTVPAVIDLQSNDFELFQLTQQADIDIDLLSRRWKELQAMTHPDRFSSQGDKAARIAMQYSIRVNEAYKRLKSPLTRFAYLCELHGAPIDAESNTSMDVEFLSQQMQWREALEDSNSLSDIVVLQNEVDELKVRLSDNCLNAIDQQCDYVSASKIVRSMMFVEKFQHDIDKKIDLLERS